MISIKVVLNRTTFSFVYEDKYMNTNQQSNQDKNIRRVPVSVILQSREMTESESIQYQCWLDRKDYEWNIN